MDQIGTMTYIMKIRQVFRSPAIDMIIRMITYGMTQAVNPIKNIRMLSDIIPYAKKSSLGFVFLQLGQYPGSHFRNRAIIEGQEHDLFLCWDLPEKIGEKILDYFWSLN